MRHGGAHVTIQKILSVRHGEACAPRRNAMRTCVARVVMMVVLCCGVAVPPLAAQSVYGSLVGNVTDSTGAALPGATVTATQVETNLKREVVTGNTGSYSIPNIPSGTYQVGVTLAGFQTFTAPNII